MEARAEFDSWSSARALIVLVVAVVAALVVGGTGGYVVRGLTFSPSSGTTNEVHRPFVVEQAPYNTPRPSPQPEPTRDPRGFEVPI